MAVVAALSGLALLMAYMKTKSQKNDDHQFPSESLPEELRSQLQIVAQRGMLLPGGSASATSFGFNVPTFHLADTDLPPASGDVAAMVTTYRVGLAEAAKRLAKSNQAPGIRSINIPYKNGPLPLFTRPTGTDNPVMQTYPAKYETPRFRRADLPPSIPSSAIDPLPVEWRNPWAPNGYLSDKYSPVATDPLTTLAPVSWKTPEPLLRANMPVYS